MPVCSSVLLQVSALHFHYPQHLVFDQWSASFSAGVTLVCGGEGSGKSTLLQLIGGVLHAQGGSICLGEVDLQTPQAAAQACVFRSEPHSSEWDQLTVAAYFSQMAARYVHFDTTRLAVAVAGLSLTPHSHKQLFMLSTGSKRKVWLAAAWAAGATLTLLDEAFAGLDHASLCFFCGLLNQVSDNSRQAWILALYQAPPQLQLRAVIDLDVSNAATALSQIG
ncbi:MULTISPECIES: ABC transporter ATP-binding protein [unclassified Undibacterium]|uniref:ABC transporter ATP-binding protein n=1 Tax=unclassified Undibacterium TaxID=2630295 RepID=UPI002AC8CFD4|nr:MULTISPECIES: ATP-binding cassette domain-containing protein [unclassified Undibacterium]MEB0138805.1 ATP-binding cassette domain-containing protein [Undibacterium sp. CCC2.1]MEB0170719.1 ATP-binding cassette domain-containing protein [Undibacterium sp. CCC1.1]MEB0174608.1 ATP-binding cassette domain-containing protein [Undibacterium sp. CCC3.4]MEB0213805.1 ATP-binding cassette domain-containing protein [Undibacterium sp. 5I2]WPX42533.1 ATP-binding cassette domain-containing protein [Undiba